MPFSLESLYLLMLARSVELPLEIEHLSIGVCRMQKSSSRRSLGTYSELHSMDYLLFMCPSSILISTYLS